MLFFWQIIDHPRWKWWYSTFGWKQLTTIQHTSTSGSKSWDMTRALYGSIICQQLSCLKLYNAVQKITYWCLVGNGWEWGLLGWLLLVMTGIIPENSLRLAPVRQSWIQKHSQFLGGLDPSWPHPISIGFSLYFPFEIHWKNGSSRWLLHRYPLFSDTPTIQNLVGGLEPWNFMTFHSVGNVIIPTDELIFFRGEGIPPTSHHKSSIYHRKCPWNMIIW